MRPLRILLLAASPPDNDKVFVDEFKDVVQTAITNHFFDVDYKSSSLSDPQPPIVLHANLRCHVADVQPELLQFRPHIVHFYAHMNAEEVVLLGEGTLETEQQRSDALHRELLTQYMTTHIADVRCVLLTGCSSQAMGRRLVADARVPSVVLTTTEVHYVACQVYCAAWYAAVFAGHRVGQAAEHAHSQLEADPRTRHLGAGVIQQVGNEDLVLLPELHPIGPARARMPDTFHIPRRDIEYIKRPRVWRELWKALLEPGKRRFVVLTGLGGAGKSQLALEYITDPPAGNNRYRLIAWFPAEDPGQLLSTYLDFAEQIMGLAGGELRGKSADIVIAEVRAWLARQEHWLLVYDNATSWDAIVKYLPEPSHSRTQHIIVTSRHQNWPTTCSKVEVGEMELSECVELVKTFGSIDKHDHTQNVDIYVLADRLGRLPLALSQAAAYITRQAVSVRTYIDAYEPLLVQKSTASLPTGDPHEIVAITWDVTMRALRTEMEKKTLPPLGHILLTVCAYLGSDAIPRSLLQRWLDLAYPTLPAGVDMCSVLLGLLRDYSLIQFVDADRQAVKIHRVLRAVVKHQHGTVQPDHPQAMWIRDVWYPLPGLSWLTTVVLAVNAEHDREWERIVEQETWRRQLLPHLESLASCAPAADVLVGEVESAVAYGRLLRNVGDVFFVPAWSIRTSSEPFAKGTAHLRKNVQPTSRGGGSDSDESGQCVWVAGRLQQEEAAAGASTGDRRSDVWPASRRSSSDVGESGQCVWVAGRLQQEEAAAGASTGDRRSDVWPASRLSSMDVGESGPCVWVAGRLQQEEAAAGASTGDRRSDVWPASRRSSRDVGESGQCVWVAGRLQQAEAAAGASTGDQRSDVWPASRLSSMDVGESGQCVWVAGRPQQADAAAGASTGDQRSDVWPASRRSSRDVGESGQCVWVAGRLQQAEAAAGASTGDQRSKPATKS